VTAVLSECALAICYMAAGFGLLRCAGAFGSGASAADIVALAGLAYMCGLACTSVGLIALLCAGCPLTVLGLALVSAAFAALGAAPGLRRRSSPSWPRADRSRVGRAERWFAATLVAAVVVYAIVGFRWAATLPLTNAWDAWAMWVRKGELLYHFGSIPTPFLTSHVYLATHQNYPLLTSVMDALWFHLAGYNVVSLHAQYWTMLMMGAWAAAGIASRVTRPAVWAPLVAAITVCPAIRGQLVTLYADVPLSLFLLLGAISMAIWIQSGGRDHGLLVVGIACLAAVANTKNEGLTDAVVVLAVAWGLTLGRSLVGSSQLRGRDGLRPLLIATTVFGVSAAPWLIWLAAHHIGGDVPIGKGLDPGYVLARAWRILPSMRALYQNATSSQWTAALPVGALIVLAGMLYQPTRRAACFYAAAAVAVFLSLVWVYVISANSLEWYLTTSATRTVDDFMFIVVAAIVHLSGLVFPDVRRNQQTPGPVQVGTRAIDRSPADV
jgi:hypothetical protein